jgi:hypothetical protein
MTQRHLRQYQKIIFDIRSLAHIVTVPLVRRTGICDEVADLTKPVIITLSYKDIFA